MDCHDRSPVQEKSMSTNTIDTQETAQKESSQPKRKRPAAKTAKSAKKSRRSRKAAGKPNTERANKKAEVIALMKRARGATLAEIMATTGWQAHTVRGFVSILGSKGSEKIESSKDDAGERGYRIAK
jgi:FtsZ-interacting cell division protein ZipA